MLAAIFYYEFEYSLIAPIKMEIRLLNNYIPSAAPLLLEELSRSI